MLLTFVGSVLIIKFIIFDGIHTASISSTGRVSQKMARGKKVPKKVPKVEEKKSGSDSSDGTEKPPAGGEESDMSVASSVRKPPVKPPTRSREFFYPR